MTITLRTIKGSELTYSELDGNFTDLDNRLITVEGAAIDSGNVTGLIDSAYVALRVPASSGTISIQKFYFTTDSGDTEFVGSDDNGATLSYDSATVQVYLNGILLQDTLDYTLQGGGAADKVTTAIPMGQDHLLTITNTTLI